MRGLVACEPPRLETGVLLSVPHSTRLRARLQDSADILAGRFLWGPFVVGPVLHLLLAMLLD